MAEALERWFCVTGTIVASAYTFVRASSPAEAREKARGRNVVLAPHGLEKVGANPTEDAIVEGADGVFTVRRDAEVSEEEPDAEFLEDDEDGDDQDEEE